MYNCSNTRAPWRSTYLFHFAHARLLAHPLRDVLYSMTARQRHNVTNRFAIRPGIEANPRKANLHKRVMIESCSIVLMILTIHTHTEKIVDGW